MPKLMKAAEWDLIHLKGVLEEDDTRGATDWEMRYKEGSDTKYGSLMYSPTLNRFRCRTFNEFYGNGIVD